jgi:hypothetical protein
MIVISLYILEFSSNEKFTEFRNTGKQALKNRKMSGNFREVAKAERIFFFGKTTRVFTKETFVMKTL